MIDELIKGLPLHFQKKNSIKLYKTLEPVIFYLNSLVENLRGQTSLIKARGIFLDFLGQRYEEKRDERGDELYRQALVSKRMAVSGLPTTEFLLDVVRSLSDAQIIDVKTRYKGEVASQYFKIDTNMDFSKIDKCPNLNKICEAGAKMYWEFKLSDENLIISFGSVVNTNKIITLFSNFEIDQTLKIIDERKFAGSIGIHKIINVGGIK